MLVFWNIKLKIVRISGDDKIIISAIYLLSKMVAIFSFLSLLIMLLLVIKKINNSVFGAIIMASLFVGIVGAQAYQS